MSSKFNFDDPDFWNLIDWDSLDTNQDIKSDRSVNYSDANRQRYLDPEYRQAHQERMRALAQDPTWKSKVDAMLKARAKDPEWKKKNAEAAKLRGQNPAIRARQSATMLRLIAENPDILTPLIEASRAYHALESTKQAKSERMLSKWQDAEYRNTMEQMQLRLRQDPAHIAKCHAALADRFVAFVTPFGEYECGADFEREHPIKLRDRLLQMPHLYYRKADGPGAPTYETVYVTEFGDFQTLKQAYAQAVELGLAEPGQDVKRWWRQVSKNPKFYKEKRVRQEWGARKHKKKRI